ncbi:MAG: TonB-dependent receptor [Pseudomonadota bacterium]
MNRQTLVFLCMLVATFGAAVPAVAAAEDIDEIIVSAARLPLTASDMSSAVSVVEIDEIQNGRQLLSVDEALVAIPGVFIQDRYNFAQDLRISMRGFGARSSFGIRGIRIIVDGIPETFPDGQAQSDSIDLGSIERMEILRGPASALYGNAAGGVINIETDRANEQPYTDVSASAGSYGFQRLQVKLGGTHDGLGYQLSASDLQLDGYRGHSAAKTRLYSARLSKQLSDTTRLSLVASHSDQPLAQDPGGVNRTARDADPRAPRQRNEDFNAGESFDQQRLGVSLQHEFANALQLNLRNYYVWRDFENRLPFVGGGAVSFDRFLSGGGVSLSAQMPVFGVSGTTVFGIDIESQEDDRQRRNNDSGLVGALTLNQLEKVRGTGVFVQQRFEFSPTFALDVGLRHDSVKFSVDDQFLSNGDQGGSQTLRQTSPSLGLLWRANSNAQLFLKYGTSFETPTTTEFANPLGGGFNENLEPQLARNAELGVRYRSERSVNYELSLFHIALEDELLPFELASQPGRVFYANANESSRRGIELSVQTTLFDSWRARLGYTWSDFEFRNFVDGQTDLSGRDLPGIPEHRLALSLQAQFANGAYLGLDTSYTSRIFLNNSNSADVGGYGLTDIRAGRRFGDPDQGWELFVGINNLFDRAYDANLRPNAFGSRYFEPGPARHWYAGFRKRWEW